MKVTCHSCGAKYAIADDKVRGRRVKVRCKSCTTPIVVDGHALEADAAAEAIAGSDDDEATRVAHGPLGHSEPEWSVNLSDTDQRTMSADEIVSGWHSGQIREDAFVWKDGMDDWKPVLEVPELASRFFERRPSAPAAAAAPAPIASPAPWQAQSSGNGSSTPAGSASFGFGSGAVEAAPRAATARVSGGRAHGRQDMFGNVSQAGNEAEASDPHAAASPGSTPYEEAKPTGARNENSVLFSLDALKVGFTPAAQAGPAPKKGAAQAGASSGSTSMDDLMNIGGASNNPLFGMNANHALLHAPPPPEPPPPPPPSFADSSLVPSYAGAGAPAKSSKLLLAVAAAVVILLVVGVGLAVVISNKNADAVAQLEKEKKAAEDAAAEERKKAAAAERAREEEKKREAEAKREEATGAATDSPAKQEEEAKKDPSKPITEEDRKRYAEAQKKREEEAKKQPDAPKEEVKKEPSTGVASFNKGAAISALSSAASAASGCKRPDGPTGSGKAVVTFAPSGNVTSATVSGGSFGGTSVGGCIASVFRRAKVPPFEGGPVTVSKSFSIAP
jgi:predicted Zn finger-like uncharacterized protein